MLLFITEHLIVLVLIGMLFVVILDLEMLHWRISLSWMLLLMFINFVTGLLLELMYTSLTINIRSCLIHLHGFQVLLLLPLLLEITSFIFINRVNLLWLRPRSDSLVITAKRLLKLLKLLMLIKEKESIPSQKFGSLNFLQFNSILKKD